MKHRKLFVGAAHALDAQARLERRRARRLGVNFSFNAQKDQKHSGRSHGGRSHVHLLRFFHEESTRLKFVTAVPHTHPVSSPLESDALSLSLSPRVCVEVAPDFLIKVSSILNTWDRIFAADISKFSPFFFNFAISRTFEF